MKKYICIYEKYIQNWIIGLTNHLLKTILSNVYIAISINLKNDLDRICIRFEQHKGRYFREMM